MGKFQLFFLLFVIGLKPTGAFSANKSFFSEDLKLSSKEITRADSSVKENKKVVAVLLAVIAGPFGAHRLYLGTSPIVPAAYTLTLGGGMGLLPLLDIVAILTSRDISRFAGSDKLVMWLN